MADNSLADKLNAGIITLQALLMSAMGEATG